ncbi:Cytochrome P450 protein [Gossypium arboreum]|uniref:Cytochrome P450 protein n=1 Tax=Gossypium arboreum TaxID=29729 RepID=A0A0B0NRV2_GOSAR|nr:Cytochrome P450 protein [Gossypium arboreum]
MGNLLILSTAFLCLCLFVALLYVLYKYWWVPHRVQFIMNSQGIRGPPYEFIHGNNKEALQMQKEASSKPMALTHDIFPRVMPYDYSCIKKYGKNYLSWNGVRAQLVITDPELVKEVLKNSEKAFSKPKPLYFFKKLLGDTIPTINSEKWARHRKLANHAFHGESLKIVKQREEKVMTGEVDSFGHDFLGLLVNAYHDPDEKNRLSIQDVVDWQDKARAEVVEVFGNQNPNSEGITKLKTITMIINETLRLYPPINSVVRKAVRDVQLGNLVLPNCLDLNIRFIALHHDPALWGDDVHLFKPERFAEGIAKATNNNAVAFMPFGMGHRSCVGMSFSITETKIALSMILQRYTFTLSPTYVHAPLPNLSLKPQHGLHLLFHSLD